MAGLKRSKMAELLKEKPLVCSAFLFNTSNSQKSCKTMTNDTSFNKISEIHQLTAKTEQYKNLAIQIFELLNESDGRTGLMRNILSIIKTATGFEAVGIRLREGDDFPYYETIGFSKSYVKAERYLCSRDRNGNLILDSTGTPYLECMCGKVILGRTDPTRPFFTKGGSFWTNSTSALLYSKTEEDRQGHTRNRCNSEGYESVALIPLRYDKGIFGLLQLNDRRKNLFTAEYIYFFESLGSSIGIALKLKKQAQDNFIETTYIQHPFHSTLSKRELEVLMLIASGMSARQIGKLLLISERTVTTHRSNIMQKLNIYKSVDLVRYAVSSGLVNYGFKDSDTQSDFGRFNS